MSLRFGGSGLPLEIENYLRDPMILGVAGLLILVIVVVVFLMISRSRGRSRVADEQHAAEAAAVDREWQLGTGFEQLRFSGNTAELTAALATLFATQLSMPILAIYAGRETNERLDNLLLAQQPASGTGSLAFLPPTLPSLALGEYRAPQSTWLTSFTGARTGELVAPGGPPADTRRVAVFPWHGPFGWKGLVITRLNEAGLELLTRRADLMAQVGNRLGVALEFDGQRSELSRSERRLAEFASVAVGAFGNLGASAPLDSFVRDVAALLSADSAAVWRLDPSAKMLSLTAQHGLRSAEFLPVPFGQGFGGRVAESGGPVAVADAPADPRCLFPNESREAGIGSYLGVPVFASGYAIAVVSVHTVQPRRWSERDTSLLQLAADLIAAVMTFVPPAQPQAPVQPQPQARVEVAYQALAQALQRLRTKEEVMDAATQVLGHALGVSRSLIVEYDPPSQQGRQPSKPVSHEYCEAGVPSAIGLEFTPAFADRVIAESGGTGAVSSHSSADGSLMEPELVEKLQVTSEMAVPVEADGQLMAVIYLNQCANQREWQNGDAEFASRVGKQLELSLATIRALNKATEDARAAREEIRQLSEVNARAVGLIESMPEPVIGLDQAGRVSFFNAAARSRLGLSNDDLGHLAELSESLTMSDETIWEKITACDTLTHMQSQLLSPALYEGARKSGALTPPSPIPVSISISPVKNDNAEITGRIVLLSDVSHLGSADSRQVSASIAELEYRRGEAERALIEARAEEHRWRSLAERSRASEAEARATLDEAARAVAALQAERDRSVETEKRTRRSAQQLMDVNRLKSELIVKAGRELDDSLQVLLSTAETFERGSYGVLSAQQLEAIRSICDAAHQMKKDLAWMVEYVSSRPPRIEAVEGQSAGGDQAPVEE
ncbi:MAG TPA: GAF domain-containing protein [Blastocatellia bacterium]|nr:GAF domain-containing protein [Blastocatellia bacterium]